MSPTMPPIDRPPRLAWFALAAVLAVGGPLHVAMPLTADAAHYDVQARIAAEGGVLYRDAIEPNLPGAVWLHGAIRPWIGDTSEALRLFDLAVFAAIVLLLAGPINDASGPAAAIWTSTLLFVAYFSMSEWCHCQRDTWMLLPAAAALRLRMSRSFSRDPQGSALREYRVGAERSPIGSRLNKLTLSFVEGLLWATAFWLKPHVAIPALACLVVSGRWAPHWRAVLVDWLSVLLGGLVVGAIGIVALVRSGAWPWFWEMLTVWNPEYLAVGRSRWTWSRIASMVDRLQPWMLLHLVAIPVAVRFVLQRPGISSADRRPASFDIQSGSRCRASLLGALYLGWLAQAILLQHAFDYVQAPPILMAIVVLGAVRLPEAAVPLGRVALVGFAGLVVLSSPLFQPSRLACWPRAIVEGSTPEVRDRLAIVGFVGWREMADVERFLDEHADDDRTGVVCYSGNLVHLYAEGRFVPPTRYVYLQPSIRCFPTRLDEIREDLAASGARYVVTSMIESGLPTDEALAEADEHVPPPAYAVRPESFPWTYPVVYRSGRYLVHRIDGPPGELGVELRSLDPPRRHAAGPGRSETR